MQKGIIRIGARIVLKAACQYYKCTKDELTKPQTQSWVRKRQAVFYVARILTQDSLPQIGRVFGKDHTTVLHNVRMARMRINVDEQFSKDVYRLERLTQEIAQDEISNILQWTSPTCYNAQDRAQVEVNNGERRLD